MDILQSNKKRGIPKVDLTAMVDLGFLLITFFMLATSFVKPKVMEVLKPMDGDPTPYPKSKTATLILGDRDKIYTYSLADNEFDLSLIDSMDYTRNGLRAFIQKRQSEVEAIWGDQDQLMVVIKPMQNSAFKNIVDVMDEMLINDVKRYAIVDPTTVIDSMIIRKAAL